MEAKGTIKNHFESYNDFISFFESRFTTGYGGIFGPIRDAFSKEDISQYAVISQPTCDEPVSIIAFKKTARLITPIVYAVAELTNSPDETLDKFSLVSIDHGVEYLYFVGIKMRVVPAFLFISDGLSIPGTTTDKTREIAMDLKKNFKEFVGYYGSQGETLLDYKFTNNTFTGYTVDQSLIKKIIDETERYERYVYEMWDKKEKGDYIEKMYGKYGLSFSGFYSLDNYLSWLDYLNVNIPAHLLSQKIQVDSEILKSIMPGKIKNWLYF